MQNMEIAREHMTAGILAGGQGRRLGGIDKGWYALGGESLIQHTIARVAPQCGSIVISANRSLARYRALGYPVHPDDSDDVQGPLAGIATILRTAVTPYVLVVPVDTPGLPLDMASQLALAMQTSTQLAQVCCEDRVQPLHALMRRDVLADLETALFAGIRATHEWQAQLDRVLVDWPVCDAFTNINTEADARELDVHP